MAIINTSNGAMQAEVTDQQFAVVSAMLTEQRKSQDFIASCAMTALAAENAKLREALTAVVANYDSTDGPELAVVLKQARAALAVTK